MAARLTLVVLAALVATAAAQTVCVYPNKNMGTCIKETVAFAPRDCPPKSNTYGGKGAYYVDLKVCCDKEFGGKCKDYSNCVYPDKRIGTCVQTKVEFSPRDCPSLSSTAGGKGAAYGNLKDCCTREFAKCTCAYPIKRNNECRELKTNDPETDCGTNSRRYDGLGQFYSSIKECCAKFFNGRCTGPVSG